jgi:hypothetical protein
MRHSGIAAFAFLLLLLVLVIPVPMDFAVSVIPGWHFPEFILPFPVIGLVLLADTLTYLWLSRNGFRTSRGIVILHLLLSAPVVLLIGCPYLMIVFPVITPNDVGAQAALDLLRAGTVLFLIGQFLFFCAFITTIRKPLIR